jgi:hypothetical protein
MLATWNVCTFHRAGAMNEIVTEMDKCKIFMCYTGNQMGKERKCDGKE